MLMTGAMCNVYSGKYHCTMHIPYCNTAKYCKVLLKEAKELQGLLTTGAINFKATDILPALGLEHVLAKLTVRIMIIITSIIVRTVTMIMIIKTVIIMPHICHGRRPCKFFLPGVKFSRLNAKNLPFYTMAYCL